MGGWAPVPVAENDFWDRPGITTITVEVEDYYPSETDDSGEMEKWIWVHSQTLRQVFLEWH